MTQDSFSYLLPDQKLSSLQPTDSDIFLYQNGNRIRRVFEKCQYDEAEHRQIEQFRTYCLDKYDLTDIPDHTILRYLYSFGFKHPEVLEKLKIFCDWYNNPKIQRIDRVTLDIINSGVCYTYGRDKFLRPVIYLNVAKMDMEKYTLEDYLSATNAIMTLAVQKIFIKGKVQNYLFIIDTEGKNFGSLPLNTVKEMTLLFSYVYSMRMGKLLIINCNYLIKLMYSAVSPFLADITKEKINLLSISQIQEGKLKQYIDINELQQKYGGFRENLITKWPPQVPGKSFKKKEKQLQDYSFDKDLESEDNDSVYFSCQNDSGMFYKLDQNSVSTQGCCSSNQCTIY